ncbi:putative RNA polymerase, sigma 70 family subunit [Thermocrinis albus DSM 14484]|uniref:Putative RNA polymerase, sigma 70 family subunit n=1 Tax=Thermocrinis albus (strain DSM 14484 / JCM 11386 / HI 11/12) TaxID=638303 RepID=D3SMZ9_THEAH|nr:RNA polymerase sigma factor RpoD/SigA [Thermocrinis albus]ADC90129.1 putative RNA polymerase, sigma 70 family subunit [Thermocrinis albus DSM 14484]
MMSDTEQEILAQYLKKVSKIPLLTPEEEKELARRAKEGDTEALRKLVESNLRFVISIAKQYQGYGLPLSELIAAGNYGLVEAAKRFDPDRGVKFISYAVWWIRQAIMQALSQQSGAVRIPLKQSHVINRIASIYSKLYKEQEKEPTAEEVAYEYTKEILQKEMERELGRPPTEEEIERRIKKEGLKISPQEVEKCLQICKAPLSLDAPIGEDEDTFFVDLLSKHGSADVEEKVLTEFLEKEIEEMLDKLPEKERRVIELRFGLRGEEPRTLREIGEILNISRERVRQLETRALRKLRNMAMKKHLKDFLS